MTYQDFLIAASRGPSCKPHLVFLEAVEVLEFECSAHGVDGEAAVEGVGKEVGIYGGRGGGI